MISAGLSKLGNTMCLQGTEIWLPSLLFTSASTRGLGVGEAYEGFPATRSRTLPSGLSCLANTGLYPGRLDCSPALEFHLEQTFNTAPFTLAAP